MPAGLQRCKMDIFTKEKRAQIMASVKSEGNRSTEALLATALRRAGVTGWRRHRRIVVGEKRVRPDFVFPIAKVAVFVHGCYWHGCRIHGTRPSTRQAYWTHKIKNNQARDKRVSRSLRGRGWIVIQIWEHSLKKDIDGCLKRIRLAVGRAG
jgi:DNA mismatch endonuclease (patch repair protein)